MSSIQLLECPSANDTSLRHALAKKTRPILPKISADRTWKRLLQCFHSSGYMGEGQRIAIIDTGYAKEIPQLSDATETEIDYTNEGIDDKSGHGTFVSLLALAVAPKAKLVHIKAFDKHGHCPGGSDKEKETTFANAIREAKQAKATVVNISAGCEREWNGNDRELFDLGSRTCSCDICSSVEHVAEDDGTSFFAAVGNVPRSRSHWMCPASAVNATPVFGLDRGKPIAVPSQMETAENAIGAAGVFSALNFQTNSMNPFWWQMLVRMRDFLWPAKRAGSSFATPLVSGMAALVREVFTPEVTGKTGRFFKSNSRQRESTSFMCNLSDFFDGYTLQLRHEQQGMARALAFELNLQNAIDRGFEKEEYDRCIRRLLLQIELFEMLYGEKHALLVRPLNNLAVARLRSESYIDVESPLLRALDILNEHSETTEYEEERIAVESALAEYRTIHEALLRELWTTELPRETWE